MRLQDWLTQAKGQIDALDAELMAVKIFAPQGTDRSWLVAHNNATVDKTAEEELALMLEKRQSGMPLAYILGEKEFYGRKFEVTPDVLIPRPETETLIDLIKALPLSKQPNFLEIGTGSGCIAVTLALEFPQSYVLATDISVKALDVAYRNDIVHEGRVEFVRSNLLREISPDEGRFDVLVANLPYVDPKWDWISERALAFEPETALYVEEEGGLALYRRLFRSLKLRQGKGGFGVNYVVVEADPCQHEQLIKLAEQQDLIHLKTEGFGVVFEQRRRFWAEQRLKKLQNKS